MVVSLSQQVAHSLGLSNQAGWEAAGVPHESFSCGKRFSVVFGQDGLLQHRSVRPLLSNGARSYPSAFTPGTAATHKSYAAAYPSELQQLIDKYNSLGSKPRVSAADDAAERARLKREIALQREAQRLASGDIGESIGREPDFEGDYTGNLNEAQEKNAELARNEQGYQLKQHMNWDQSLEKHLRLLHEYNALGNTKGAKDRKPRLPMASYEEEAPLTEPGLNPVLVEANPLVAQIGVVPPPAALPPDVPEACRPGPELLKDLSSTVWAPDAPSISKKLNLKLVLPPEQKLPPGQALNDLEAGMPALALYLAALAPRLAAATSMQPRRRYPSVGRMFL